MPNLLQFEFFTTMFAIMCTFFGSLLKNKKTTRTIGLSFERPSMSWPHLKFQEKKLKCPFKYWGKGKHGLSWTLNIKKMFYLNPRNICA